MRCQAAAQRGTYKGVTRCTKPVKARMNSLHVCAWHRAVVSRGGEVVRFTPTIQGSLSNPWAKIGR